ncbi:hypothetical protein E3E36_04315 [Thermococcus sp. M36]|uniref:hypothetical protein n=1 Tax=Thermococcus sp. M36 TaxID=1638261 RepID=UPI00143C581F|nr:hypothetical protein [Thermococcus sp. M36]NJE05377.1 hypothetical protein [Thermococcus sp. M36]
MRALTLVKLSVVVPVIALTALAYSSIFPGVGRVLGVSLAVVLMGVFLSSRSAGRVVFTSVVLYTVPFTIALSQFLPVAFPSAYQELGSLITGSPYFSDERVLFLLVSLGILGEYVETTDEWERALLALGREGTGVRVLVYGLPAFIASMLLSFAVFAIAEAAGVALAGVVLPFLMLATGLAVSYGTAGSGRYRRVVAAVEVEPPAAGGEVRITLRDGEVVVPVSPSAGFEWRVLRIEVELKKRPIRVVFMEGGRETVLVPMMESTDGDTLFVLYHPVS